MRVMFVDDEPAVLQSISATLGERSQIWDVVYAAGADQALAELEAEPFDLVVADLDMPGMDGTELLRQVNRRYPDTMRVILSDDRPPEHVFKAVPVAQQFLQKPCDVELLEGLVNRATEFCFEVQNSRVREIISQVDQLPSVPDVYIRLSEVLDDPNSTASDVAEVIGRDPAIAAKILQIANSPIFRRGNEIQNTRDAVARLGVRSVHSLVLAAHVFDGQNFKIADETEFSIFELQADAMLTSEIARRLPSEADKADVMTAALMHDIGRLLIASQLPMEYRVILAHARSEEISLVAAEQEILGVSHADIGGHLLSMWGLPDRIVESVSWHHIGPRWQAEPKFDLAATLHVSVCLAHNLQVAPDLAEAWGIGDKLSDFQSLADDLRAAD